MSPTKIGGASLTVIKSRRRGVGCGDPSSSGAEAQGTPQTVEFVKVDVHKLAAGYRASKVIGSSVVNGANETIGKIADLLVSPDGKQPYAVLSIGGLLGHGPLASSPMTR
jgi:hypothetical protein